MSDIFDELTRDVKDEKVQRVFVNLLPKVGYFTAAVIVIMLLKNFFDSKKLEHNMKIGDMFHKVFMLNDNDQKEISYESLQNLLKTVDNSQKDLMELHEIKILSEEKNFDIAQEKLKNIFESPSSKELTRAYARLLWSEIELNKSNSSMAKNEIEKNIALSAAKGSVFYGSGSVIYSLWLIKNNREAEAKSILEEVMKTENIPSSVLSSASAILSNLSN